MNWQLLQVSYWPVVSAAAGIVWLRVSGLRLREVPAALLALLGGRRTRRRLMRILENRRVADRVRRMAPRPEKTLITTPRPALARPVRTREQRFVSSFGVPSLYVPPVPVTRALYTDRSGRSFWWPEDFLDPDRRPDDWARAYAAIRAALADEANERRAR